MIYTGEISEVQNMIGLVCRQAREHEESIQDFDGGNAHSEN